MNPSVYLFIFWLFRSTKYPTTGQYLCKVCSSVLYTANTKFDSGCGWPVIYFINLWSLEV